MEKEKKEIEKTSTLEDRVTFNAKPIFTPSQKEKTESNK